MNETFVYLEGSSDKLGLEKLLAGPLAAASRKGNAFFYFELGGKKPLLNKGPGKAIAILRNRPKSRVFLVPDLYPPNTPFDHKTFEQLKAEIEIRFQSTIKREKLDARLAERFKVHCFKYDLEVLLLASEQPLLHRLGTAAFAEKWKKPVEDQDHDHPPKRIVEKLFKNAGRSYRDTADVPWMLERASLDDLKVRCPQRFGPFVEELLTVVP